MVYLFLRRPRPRRADEKDLHKDEKGITVNTKILTLATMTAIAGMASADIVVSYSYTDLNGAFDAGTGIFTADAIDSALFSTGGDVSRNSSPKGSADFLTGFFGIGASNVSIEMEVWNITATTADGAGRVVLTDFNGDTLSATFEGFWSIINPFGFMFFNGVSIDYAFDNSSGDGTFDGSVGSFSLAGLLDRFFDGAISILLRNPGGFSDSFENRSTQADGILIPTPGTIALLGVGLTGVVTRRRR